LLIAAAIALLAFFVQGFTGFGASLILAPLLLFVFDLRTGVVASAIVQLPIGLGLTGSTRSQIAYRELRTLLPTSIAGLIVGVAALASLDVDWLKRVCGVLTVVFALRMLRRARQGGTSRAWPRWSSHLAGLIGGLLGGLFGTSGPPVVIVLERQLKEKLTLRATLLAYFLVINALRVMTYAAGLLVSGYVLVVSLAMLPAAVAGALLGARLQHRVSDQAFRLVVTCVLLLTGLALTLGR
jgi:uncharacterized protein